MKLIIEKDGKEYTLEFDRKQAIEVSKNLATLKDEDVFEQAYAMIAYALEKNHSDLTADERQEIAEYVCEEYSLVDGEEVDSVVEKGLFSNINEMISEAIPKGFTNKATKKAVVVK
ncbi:MAG: hypothetical protein RRZ69_00015 [Clostridia bacterium]